MGFLLNKILLHGFWCVLLVEVILPQLTEGIPMNIQYSTAISPLCARMIADMTAQSRPYIPGQSPACLQAFRCMAGANPRDFSTGRCEEFPTASDREQYEYLYTQPNDDRRQISVPGDFATA